MDLGCSAHKESPSTQVTGQPTLKGGIPALDIDRIIDSLEVSHSESDGEALDLRLSPVLSIHREEGIMEASAALAPGHLHPSEESQSDGSSSEMDPEMDVLATPSKSLDIEEVVKASSILNTPVKRGTESSQSPCAFQKHPPIWASLPDVPPWELGEPEPILFELDDEDEPENVVQNRSLDNSKAGSSIEILSPSKKVVAPRNMVFSPRTKAPTPPSQPPLEVEEEEFMIVDEGVVSAFNFSRNKRRLPRPKELETSSSSEHGGSPGKVSKDFSTEEEEDAREKKPVKTGSSQSSSKAASKKYPKRSVTISDSSQSPSNTPVKKTGSSQSSKNTPVKSGSAQSSRNTPVRRGPAQSSSKAGSKKYPKRKVSSDSSAGETEEQPTKDSSEEEKTDHSGKGSKDFSTEEEEDAREKKPVKTGSSQSSSKAASKKYPKRIVTISDSSQSPSNTPVKKTGSSQSSKNTPVKSGSSQSSRNTPVRRGPAQSSSKAGSKKYPKRKVSSDSSAGETEEQPTKDSSEEEKTDHSDSVVLSSKRQRRPPGDWWLSHSTISPGIVDLPTSDRTKQSPSKTLKEKPTAKTDGTSENGNMAISPKPQRGAAELSLIKTLSSTPKAVGRVQVLVSSSPGTGSATNVRHEMEDGIYFPVEEEQASPPSYSSLSEDEATASHSVEQSAMEDAATATHSVEQSAMEDEASGNPAVEVSASDANQRQAVIGASWALTETPVRRWPSQEYGFPSRNRLSDKSQGFVSGPSSLIELDSREEEDAFLPSSTVQSRCPVTSLSATEMCVFPLAPVSLTDRDQEDLTVWWNIVCPATALDAFHWFSYRGRILGVCTDIVHDGSCAGKVFLGSNMRKPLWVDHSATTVFHVMMGCVALTMDGETSRYSQVQSFIVPCGHAHSLKNLGEQPVMLGFTRILAPEPASDDDQ